MVMNKLLPPVLSFFTGGGFMDMGFEKAGFNIVWTNEFDMQIADLFGQGITSWNNSRGNTGEYKISNRKSIKDLTSKEILKEAFLDNATKIFGMIGGPPCQDFSMNGNLVGFKGDKGSLTDAYLCKILDLQPSFFVMENVAGLLKVKKNSGHFLHLLDILSELYLIDFDILNSLDFGVPQNRERVFVVGINKGKYNTSHIPTVSGRNWFPFPKGTQDSKNKNRYKWPEPKDFNESMEKPDSLPFNLCVESCLVPTSEELKVPNAKEYFNLFIPTEKLNLIKEGETNRPSFKRLHRYKYSPTTCYGNNEVHLHPYINRRLSVRETLRIQSVDDTYILSPKLPLSKKFKMIGNGVPVYLAEAVGKTLANFLFSLKIL